jgi:hypothetical protein
MALLVDIRNLKRIKRIQVVKSILCGFKHIVRSYIKKIKLDSLLRTILGFTPVNREGFANTIRSILGLERPIANIFQTKEIKVSLII